MLTNEVKDRIVAVAERNGGGISVRELVAIGMIYREIESMDLKEIKQYCDERGISMYNDFSVKSTSEKYKEELERLFQNNEISAAIDYMEDLPVDEDALNAIWSLFQERDDDELYTAIIGKYRELLSREQRQELERRVKGGFYESFLEFMDSDTEV